jgi:hypothetical protein
MDLLFGMVAGDTKLVVALVATGTLILLIPIIGYLTMGWYAKRADIMDGLNPNARRLYFKMFCRAEATPTEDEAMQRLDQVYNYWYGIRLFVMPAVVLLGVCTLSLCFVAASTFKAGCCLPTDFPDVGGKGVAAIAGAYMWVVNDLISRARRLDLSPSDLTMATLRFAIAVPLGYSVAEIAPTEATANLLAFSLGTFPLNTVTKMLRRFFVSQLSYTDDKKDDPNSDELLKLQGVNSEILDRFANEDITTITQLAYCDPIRITMRSNLTFNVVTDCMSQALAWQYFGEGMNAIRKLGLRGAVEIKHFVDDFENADAEDADHKTAVTMLPDVANALGQTPATVILALQQIAQDPFTDYLYNIWE